MCVFASTVMFIIFVSVFVGVSCAQEQYFSDEDFQVGAVLVIYARAFELLDADHFTLRHMESNGSRYPHADYDQVCGMRCSGCGSAFEVRSMMCPSDLSPAPHSVLEAHAARSVLCSIKTFIYRVH